MSARVGKYVITSTLGRGAFGKVKLGMHSETQVECAFARFPRALSAAWRVKED